MPDDTPSVTINLRDEVAHAKLAGLSIQEMFLDIPDHEYKGFPPKHEHAVYRIRVNLEDGSQVDHLIRWDNLQGAINLFFNYAKIGGKAVVELSAGKVSR
jgi:predicted metal-dependent phosphotriesterase family hydrolase